MRTLIHLSLFLLFLSLELASAQDYVPNVIWDRSGLEDSSSYGTQILPLGDQNSDGLADWAVVAWGNGRTQRSYLEFFYGANPLPTEPYHTLHVDTTQFIAFNSKGTGDFNGDGYVDWILAETRPVGYDVALFYGGSATNDTPRVVFHKSDNVAVVPVQDFNVDGFADLYFYDFDTDDAWICYGGNPMDTIPDWTLHVPPPGINQSYPYAFGDFTGDGAADFLCFNPNNWNAVIFLGATQPDTIPDFLWTLSDRVPIDGIKSLNGDNAAELVVASFDGIDVSFGRQELSPMPDYTVTFSCEGGPHTAVSGCDFNADGYNDMITFVPSCTDNMFGSLTLHLGHPWLNAEPAFVVDGDTPPFDLIGIYTAAGLGDVNGDSIDDIAIGAWDDFAQAGWRGRCVIIAGDDSLEVSADDSRPELPQQMSMEAYPNPFNSEATLRLQAPMSSEPVILRIFNVLGQEVRNERLLPFTAECIYHFNAGDLPSGLYLAQAKSGDLQTTQKLMLLK